MTGAMLADQAPRDYGCHFVKKISDRRLKLAAGCFCFMSGAFHKPPCGRRSGLSIATIIWISRAVGVTVPRSIDAT